MYTHVGLKVFLHACVHKPSCRLSSWSDALNIFKLEKEINDKRQWVCISKTQEMERGEKWSTVIGGSRSSSVLSQPVYAMPLVDHSAHLGMDETMRSFPQACKPALASVHGFLAAQTQANKIPEPLPVTVHLYDSMCICKCCPAPLVALHIESHVAPFSETVVTVVGVLLPKVVDTPPMGVWTASFLQYVNLTHSSGWVQLIGTNGTELWNRKWKYDDQRPCCICFILQTLFLCHRRSHWSPFLANIARVRCEGV